jgi:flagellar biosynthetic protein FliQ
MHDVLVYDLWRGALMTIVTVAAPFVILALVVGLTMSIVQAATQLQENVLSFVPKVVALAATLTLAGPWALDRLTHFTQDTMQTIERVGASGPQ